jgi:multisubunit Na+/H+ antiporter MnhE subunit
MKKRSKSAKDLVNRSLLSKELLEKKFKRSYKVKLRHLKLLLLLQLSHSSQLLKELYAANFAVVVVVLKDIKSIDVLIVLVINFLYIICMGL